MAYMRGRQIRHGEKKKRLPAVFMLREVFCVNMTAGRLCDYSARSENSAPEAYSCPFCSLRALKRM